MRRFQKIRGAMLIYAFIIVSLLIVLLTASMLQLQNSVFLTKKMEAETKAYWVSFAGAEYADAKITQNITWPMQNISYKTTIGAYEITEEVVGNYVRIRGTYKEKNSSSIDSEFYLAFKTDLPSAPPAGEFSIVPTPLIKDLSTPSKNISCYSINAVTVASNPGGGLKIDNKLGQDNEDYVIFKTAVDHKVKLPYSVGVYISCEGRNRTGHMCRLEKFCRANLFSDDFSAALYVDGKLKADIHGRFSVTSEGARKPSIVIKNGMTLNSSNPLSNDYQAVFSDTDTSLRPDKEGNGPIALHDGTIYVNNSPITINNVPIFKGDPSNSEKYGFNVEQLKDVDLPIPQKLDIAGANQIPGGYYNFIEKEQLSAGEIVAEFILLAPTAFNDIMGGLSSLTSGVLSSDQVIDFMRPILTSFFNKVIKLVFNNYDSGGKYYQLIYFPNAYGDPVGKFSPEQARRSTLLLTAKDWLDDLGGPLDLGQIVKDILKDTILKPFNALKNAFNTLITAAPRYVLQYYISGMKDELGGDFVKFDRDSENVFYGFEPNGINIDKTKLYEAPFEIGLDGRLTLNIRKDLEIVNGDFTFQTIEIQTPTSYKPTAIHSKSALVIEKDGATSALKKLKIKSENSIDLKSFLIGNLEMRSDKDIKLEAGGQIDASKESEIAILANNIEINYFKTDYTPCYAPECTFNAIKQVSYPSSLSIPPSFYDDRFTNFVKSVLSKSVLKNPDKPSEGSDTLGNILQSYGYNADLQGSYSQKNYIYNFICRYPNFKTMSPSEVKVYRPFLPSSNIRGLVYAYNDLTIDVDDNRSAEVAFEGVVVCKGNFNVTNVNNLAIRYNPNLSIISAVLDTQQACHLTDLYFNKF